MTTIAYRGGILAADSCETIEGGEDAGTYKTTCEKLFRVGPCIVALQGDSSPGMVWLRWFSSQVGIFRPFDETIEDHFRNAGYPLGSITDHARKMFDEHKAKTLASFTLPVAPNDLTDRFLANDADFTAVVLAPGNKLYEYDAWGIPILVTAEYYAVGSGAKVALGAMREGGTAEDGVNAACAHDPYTSEPVKTMRLENAG